MSRKKAGAWAISVDLADFIGLEAWAVVEAPKTIEAAKDSAPVKIILARQ